jgi:uncharacterized delta-60 repeat protein
VSGVFNVVSALALQPDGKVLIGGSFDSVGGQTRTSVARLNSDGTLDTTFGDPNVGGGGQVYALALQSDGKVLIGGYFSSVGGQTRTTVARLNSNGTLDTTFGDPQVTGLTSSSVRALAVQSDGKVLIGGYFTTVGGSPRKFAARLNSNGTLDTTFGDPNVSGGATNPTVNALALQPDEKVLIGGFFTSVGGSTRNGVARLNSNGTLDASFGNPNADDGVYALALQSDGKVLIGGLFTSPKP